MASTMNSWLTLSQRILSRRAISALALVALAMAIDHWMTQNNSWFFLGLNLLEITTPTSPPDLAGVSANVGLSLNRVGMQLIDLLQIVRQFIDSAVINTLTLALITA